MLLCSLLISYIICVLNPENLFTKVMKVVEGRLCSDRINEKETLAILHVEVTHGCELFLEYKTVSWYWTNDNKNKSIDTSQLPLSYVGAWIKWGFFLFQATVWFHRKRKLPLYMAVKPNLQQLFRCKFPDPMKNNVIVVLASTTKSLN